MVIPLHTFKKVLEYTMIIAVFMLGAAIGPKSEPVFVYTDDNIKLDVYNAVNASQKASVYIETIDGWSGSGTIIDVENGIILTAGHVTNNATDIFLTFSDGTQVRAVDWYSEEGVDIGFIQVDPNTITNISEVKLSSTDVNLCDEVYLCSCPFGYELRHSVTFGQISNINRYMPFFGMNRLIQADFQSWPGSSGGAVYNTQGEVVGILIGGMNGFDGISIIVPTEFIKASLNKYVEHLKIGKLCRQKTI